MSVELIIKSSPLIYVQLHHHHMHKQLQLPQTTTTECKLLVCKYSICAGGWEDTPPAQVAEGATTTYANGVSVLVAII